MTTAPWVWITGQSRSGTSLTAGLLAAHGVWFGECAPPDEHNPRGYFENLEIVRRVREGDRSEWPEAWWQTMTEEGYDGGPWAIKRGPNAWPWVEALRPTMIVETFRPTHQIFRSRIRRWANKKNHAGVIRRTNEKLARIRMGAECPVTKVQTNDLVKGDFRSALPVFEHLGIQFSETVAGEWIDPDIWNRGRQP